MLQRDNDEMETMQGTFKIFIGAVIDRRREGAVLDVCQINMSLVLVYMERSLVVMVYNL